DEFDAYRAPLPCESRTFELTGLSVSETERLSIDALPIDVANAGVLDFEGVPTDGIEKRLIKRSRTLYRDNTLGALALGALDTLALPYERYQLAFTPGLLTNILVATGKLPAIDVPQVLGLEAGYRDLDGDGNWWVPSGQVRYAPTGIADELS